MANATSRRTATRRTSSHSTGKAAAPKEPTAAPASWQTLLIEAVKTPGIISAAYHAFHNYSPGNQILAWYQCRMRGILPGPIATYKRWASKGRQVRRGEKAIVLCQPITWHRTETDSSGAEVEHRGMFFKYRPAWFVVSQTDGPDIELPALPGWDLSEAMKNLDIERIPFTMLDGNVQGYATRRQLAINPVAAMPMKTTFHELAHIVLGHTTPEETALTDPVFAESGTLPRNLKEAEAESVALILTESLGLDGSAECRGYVQNWLAGDEIPEKSATRIFTAADKILKAGRPAETAETAPAESDA